MIRPMGVLPFGLDDAVIGGLLNAIFSWFRDQWNSSGASAVQDAMKSLVSSPWAALDAEWFKHLWSNYFGLAVILALFFFFVRAIAFAFNWRSGDRIVDALLDVLKTFAIGVLILVGLEYTMMLVDALSNMIIAAATNGGDPNNWYQVLLKANRVTDFWGGLILSLIGMISGALLLFETVVVQQSMFVFALVFMCAFAARRWRLGNWLLQGAWAGLYLALTVKLVELIWMLPWSLFLQNSPTNNVQDGVLTMFVVLVSAWLPFGVFVGVLRSRLKHHAVVEGNVRTDSDRDFGGYDSRQLNAKYASAMMQRVSTRATAVKETAAAAGAALATVAIERGGSWMATRALSAGQPGVAAAFKAGSKAASWASAKITKDNYKAVKLAQHGHTAIDYAVRKYRNRRPGSRTESEDY